MWKKEESLSSLHHAKAGESETQQSHITGPVLLNMSVSQSEFVCGPTGAESVAALPAVTDPELNISDVMLVDMCNTVFPHKQNSFFWG